VPSRPLRGQESNVNTCAFKGITLVTAAGRGIGRAIALRPADDFDVAVNDIPSNVQALDSAVVEITTKGRRSILVLVDVSVEGQVRNMVDTVVAKLGELDVVRAVASRHSASMLMVANAGIYRDGSLLECQLNQFLVRVLASRFNKIVTHKVQLKISIVSFQSTSAELSFATNMRVCKWCHKVVILLLLVKKVRNVFKSVVRCTRSFWALGAGLCAWYSATKFVVRRARVRLLSYGPTARLIDFNYGQQANWEKTELLSLRMLQAQLIPHFVSDTIPRNDLHFNLLHMVVQKMRRPERKQTVNRRRCISSSSTSNAHRAYQSIVKHEAATLATAAVLSTDLTDSIILMTVLPCFVHLQAFWTKPAQRRRFAFSQECITGSEHLFLNRGNDGTWCGTICHSGHSRL
jgi:NAD(P)-dependent dehydrogenase (short-subunit alcohol dehydrogenase family)